MNNKFLKEKGAVALVLTILIASILLAISLTVANLVIQQSVTTRLIQESIIAYQAADSGIEYALYSAKKVYKGGGGVLLSDFYAETGLNTSRLCDKPNVHWFSVGYSDYIFYCLDVIAAETSNELISVKAIGEYAGRTRRSVEVVIQP